MDSENIVPKEAQLKGVLSVSLSPDKSLNDFCSKHFGNFDPELHDAVAIRVFSGNESVVTLYALDKTRVQSKQHSEHKIPVKKFKAVNVSLPQLLPYIQEFNFTLTAEKYRIEDMEVINK
jgi:hypothetical protein